MKIKIAYFSGTGCTEHVAKTFMHEITARYHRAEIEKIGLSKEIYYIKSDILIICFVVHAFNAPAPLFKWVEKIEKDNDIPVALIPVSGGGDVTPNRASSFLLKKKLQKNGFNVFYEKMIVMPSNIIIETKPELVNELLYILPYKVSFYTNEILKLKKSNIKPDMINRFFSRVGLMEQLGAHLFGRNIKADKKCNSCGLCVKSCPVDNIKLLSGRPHFGYNCTLCLNCIYRCPQHSLYPGIFKSFVIKKGFNIENKIKNYTHNENIDIQAETKGYLWSGLGKYLINREDIAIPTYRDKR